MVVKRVHDDDDNDAKDESLGAPPVKKEKQKATDILSEVNIIFI
jgi:hypothetical protein